jgi:hypothetical protein
MKLKFEYPNLTVTREKGDKAYYASPSSWGDAESAFLYNLKKKLNTLASGEVFQAGYNHYRPIRWIKKRMWKDGHMKDEQQQYLRTTTPICYDGDGNPFYGCLYNDHWAINGLDTDFNNGSAILRFDTITVDKTVEKRLRRR